MRGDEDGDALVACEIDQQIPEPVPRQRIDTGCGLVEDEDLGLVDHRNGQREPLADSERKVQCQMIEIVGEREAVHQIVDPGTGLVARQVKQPGVELEILPHRELGIERKRLRHVADAAAQPDVAGIDRLAEQPCLTRARRQQSGSAWSWSCRSRSSRRTRRSRRARC